MRGQHQFFDTINDQAPIGTTFLGTEPPFSVASELSTRLYESPLIAGLWADYDLDTDGTSGRIYELTEGEPGNRRYIVQWDKVFVKGTDIFPGQPGYNPDGSVTFQVILHEGSNNIEFVYPDTTGTFARTSNGYGASVGLNDGLIGGQSLEVSYEAPSATDPSGPGPIPDYTRVLLTREPIVRVTADRPEDISPSFPLEFSLRDFATSTASQERIEVELEILFDGLVEASEDVRLELELIGLPPGSNFGILADNGDATLTIEGDGRAPALGLAFEPSVGVEGGNATLVLTLSEPLNYLRETLFETTVQASDFVFNNEKDTIESSRLDAQFEFKREVNDLIQKTLPLNLDTNGTEGAEPFSFNFYGEFYDQFTVGSNGFLTLGKSDGPAAILDAPASNLSVADLNAASIRDLINGAVDLDLVPLIAPWWGGLGNSVAYFEQAKIEGEYPQRTLIVRWQLYVEGTEGELVQFQARLHENSAVIEFDYFETDLTIATDRSRGAGATIGIFNIGADPALQQYVAVDGNGRGNDGLLTENSTIVFTPSPIYLSDAPDATIEIDVEDPFQRMDFTVDFPLSVPLSEFVDGLRHTIDIPVARDTMSEGTEEVSFLVTELPLGLRSGADNGRTNFIIDPDNIRVDLEVVQERVFEGGTVDLILTLSEPLNFDPAQSEYQSEITEYTADQFAEIFEDISQDPAVRSYGLTDITSFFDLGDEDLDRGFTAEVDLGLGADGFNFYNHEFQSGYIGVNGLLALSIGEDQRLDLYDQFDASGDLSADSTRAYNDLLIAPFWTDLDLSQNSIAIAERMSAAGERVTLPRVAGGVYSLTRGEGADRRFIVQWDDVFLKDGYNSADPSSDDQALTFQLVLYEQTGDIEFRYLDVNNDASGVLSIGLNDGILGDRGVQLGNVDQSRIVNNSVVRFERVRSLFLNSDNAADFEDALPLEIPLTSFESENGTPRAEISLGILTDGKAEPQELVELQLGLASGLPLAFGDSGGSDSFIIEARQQVEVDVAVNPRRVLEGQTATVELTLSIPLPEIDVPDYQPSQRTNGNRDFTSIRADGGAAILTNQVGQTSVNLPFEFDFYDKKYSSVNVAYGFLYFGPSDSNLITIANVDYDNLGGRTLPPIIAPHWDAYDGTRSSSAVYTKTEGEEGNRRYIVEWNSASINSTDRVTFQVILHEATNDIEFIYWFNLDGHGSYSENLYGNSATVAIADTNGDEYDQIVFNRQLVRPGTRIMFNRANPSIRIDTDEQNYADLGTAFPINVPLEDFGGTLVHTIDIPVLADDITEALELVDLRLTLPEISLADHELRLGANEGRASFVIDAPDRTVDVDIAVPPGRGSVDDTATLELTLSEPTDYVWRVFSDDSNFLDLRTLPEALPANLVTASITELIDTDLKFAIPGVAPSALVSLLGDGGNSNRAQTFTFTFYGEDYSQIWINREGFLTLGGSRLYNGPDDARLSVLGDAISRNPDYNPVPGDDRALPPVIAPWWDDFAGFSDSGEFWLVHYGIIGEYPNRQLIVQWSDARPQTSSAVSAIVRAEPITFQAVLYEGTNEIEFRYLDATTDSFTPDLDGGGAATIAIADSNARGGYVQVGYNQSVVTDNSRIRFIPGVIEVDVAENQRDNFAAEFPISVPLHEFRGDTRYTIELPRTAAQPSPSVRFTLSDLSAGLQIGAGGDNFDYLIAEPIAVSLSVPNSGRVVEGEPIELYIELSEPINFNTPLSNYVARTNSYSTEQFARVFEDISQTGTPIAQLLESSPGQADLNDGWATRLFESGFQFDFYGREYDRLFVNPDGLLTFSAPGAGGTRDYGLDSSNNSGLSNVNYRDPLIAPLWNNVNLAHQGVRTGQIYEQTLGVTPNRRYILQWDGVYLADQYNADDPGVALTYQVVLYEDGGDIEFRYLDLSTGNVMTNDGGGATIGLNDGILGDRSVEVAYNSSGTVTLASGATLGDNTRIRLSRQPSLIINTADDSEFGDTFPIYLSLEDFDLENGTRQAFIVTTAVDRLFEPQPETVPLQVELPSESLFVLSGDSGTGNLLIEDRTLPQFEVRALDANGNVVTSVREYGDENEIEVTAVDAEGNIVTSIEDNGEITVEARLLNGQGGVTTRRISFNPPVPSGIGIEAGNDYQFDDTLTIEAGQSIGMATLRIVNDKVFELTEQLLLEFSVNLVELGYGTEETYQIEISVADNDVPRYDVEFTAPPNYDFARITTGGVKYIIVEEQARDITVRFAPENAAANTTDIGIELIPNPIGSATRDQDYVLLPNSGILRGQTSGEQVIRFIDDSDYEADEQLIINSALIGGQRVTFDPIIVTIRNSVDRVGLTLNSPELINEGQDLEVEIIADQFYYPASYSYSLESGTVEHFDDIVEDKNRFNIASDSSDFASIGFTFTYYGEVYDQLLVNTNGFVALRDSSQSTTELVGRLSSDNGNLELGREGTPSGRGAPIIAPYWDDLDVLDGDLVGGVYQRQFADRYVVQWNKVIFAGGSALDAVTFQLVLHKDSNRIEFRYLDVTTTETDSNGNGAQATVGLSSGGFDATQLSFDTAGIYDGLRVIFDTEPVEDIQLDIRNESDETIDFENQDPIDLIELWRNTLIGDTPRAVYTSVRNRITEGDHEYSLNFRGVASDVPGGSIFVLGPEATTTVRDDDVVSLTFREEEYVVRAGEQTGPNDILLQINPVLPFDTSVRINGRLVSDTRGDFSVRGLSPYGTITATANYTLNPVIVEGYLDVFSNAAEVTASIELTAELVGEGLLSRSNSTILNVVGAPSNEPRFTLGSNGRLVESAGSEAYIELVVDNAPAEGVYETLTVVLSTNYSGALTIVSTIPVGERSVRVPLPIDDDSEVEEDQNFLLEITSYGIGSTPVVTYPEASRPSFNLYIDDDDAQRDLNFPFVASNSRLIPGEFIELNLNVELSAPLPEIYEDDYAVRELDYSLFEDISDSGKRFLLNSTNSFLLENFGSDFEFEFYGQPYSAVGISPNGFLSFDPDYLGENSAVNGDLRIGQAGTPAGLGLPTIAAFWDELDISAADADIYVKQTGQAPNRRYIVQWDDAKIVATDVVVTFQIVLHEGSGAIEFRYDNLPDGAEDAATIGISGGGLYYLSASYNGDLGSTQSLIFDPLYRALRVPSPSDDIRPTDLVPLLRGGPIIGLPATFGLSSDQSVDALEFEPLRLVEVADADFSSTSTINFLIQPDWELSLETLSADRAVEGDRFTLTVELDQPLGPNRDQLFGTGYRVFSGTVGITGGSIVGRGGQPLSFADGTDRAIEVSNDIGFEFFGEVAPTLYVFADGYVEFEDSDSDSDGSIIVSQNRTPNFLSVPIVMPYWSEVDNNSGQVYILRESNRIILEWNGFTAPGGTARLTHQLILHAASNLIEINVLESIGGAARSAISDGRTLINLNTATPPDGTRYVLLPQTRLILAATDNDDFIGFPIDVGQHLAAAEDGTTLFEIPIETAQGNDIDLAEQTQLRLLVSGSNALRLGEARTADLELVAYQHGVLEVTTVDITAETLSVSEGSDARLKLTLAGPLLAALDNYESVIYTQDIFDFNSGGSNFELLDSNTDRLSGFNDTDDGWTTDSLPSNFNFNFYGDNYDEVYISTNGLLQFQGPNDPNPVGLSLKTNENFRETPPSNPTIAPFWDDLTALAGQNVQIYRDVRGTSPNRRYIVQWGPVYKVQDSVPLSGDGDELYFQVVLYEDNNAIEFRYHDVETSSRDRTSFKDVTALGTNYRGSSGATTGIAAGDDLNRFQQTFYGSGDSSVSPVIIGNSRIRYVPQPAFRLELNSDNGGEFDTDFPVSITSFDFSSAGEYELALPVLSDGVEEPQDLIDLRLSFNDLGIPLQFGESDGVASLIINPSSGLPNISLQPLRSSLPEGSNLLAIRVNLSRPLDSSISADTVLATIDQLSGGVEYVSADDGAGSDLFPIDILAGHFANRATRYDARVAVPVNAVDNSDRESVLGLTSVNSAIVADPSQDEVTLTIQDFDVPGLVEFNLDKQYLSEGDQLRWTLELDSPPDVPADLPAEVEFTRNQILIDTDRPELFDPAINFPIVVSGADFEGGTTYSDVLPIRPAALNGVLGQVATLEVISNAEPGLASTTREITVVDQDADFSLTLESDVVPEGAFTPAGGTARNATFEEGDPVRLTIDLSGPLSEVLRDTARRYSVSTPEVIKETDLSISADATALNLSELEPDSTIGIELPFAFDLYGVSSNDLRIGTNGFLAFGGNRSEQLGARPNTDLSNGVEGNRAVAVLWDGYRTNAPGAEIYTEERGIAPYREFIVQWQNLISRQGTSNYLVSFQAILLETSNEIILKYYDLGPVLPAREGGAATIGVGDGNGEAFLVGFNEQVISEGTVLRIAPAEYLIQVDVTDPIYRDDFEDTLPLDITDLAIADTSTIDASIFTVELPIEIDRLLEETETVDLVVRLGHGPERDPVEIEHIATTRLTIPNTDFILMNFDQALYSVVEGEGVQVRLSLTPPPQNAEYLTVTFTPDGSTPTANDDDWRIREALADGTVFVPAGSSEVVFTIEAIADGLFEGLDVERYHLTADLASSKFLNDTVRETTLEISSPDEPRVAISGPGTRELREGRGSVDINVELINIPTVGITEAIRLALELSGENSTEAILTTPALTLNENGVLSGRVTVTAIDDDDSEGDGQWFLVRVKSYSYNPPGRTGVTDESLAGSSYVLIVDDDDNVSNRVITVDFADMPTPSAVEGESLELGVVLSEPIPAENEYALNDYGTTVVAGADLFEDISFYAPRLGLANNGLYEQQFADGFEFELYGQIYNSVRVAANGFLSFGDAYTDGTGSGINADLKLGRAGTPGSAGAPIIAALWDSLSVSGEEAGVYVDLQGSAPNRRYIFQWDDVAVLDASGELISFQVVLFENGNNVELRYGPLAEETKVFDNATIGISNGSDSFRSAAFDGSGDNLGDIKKGSAILLRPLYSHLRLVPVPEGDIVTDDLYPLSQLGGATANEVITVGTLQDADDTEGTEFVLLRLISEVDRFEVPGGRADLVVAVRDNATSTVELRALNPSPDGIEHLGTTNELETVLTIDPPLGRRLNEAYTRINVSGNEFQELTEMVPLSYDASGYATIDIPGFALNVHGTDVGLSNGRVFVRDDGYLVFTDAPNAPTYSRADNASLEQITTYGPAGRDELFGVGGGTLIAPLWTNFVDGNGETFYRIEGTAPNRVLTVEWRGYLTSSSRGTPANTFQVRLSESTNIIEFHYQNIISPLPTTSPPRSSTVGIVTHNGGIKRAEQIGYNMQNTVRSGQEILLVPADVLVLESPLNENLQVSIDGGTKFEPLPFDIGSQIGPDATEFNLIFKPTAEVDANNYVETGLRLGTSNADAFELGDDLAVSLGRDQLEIYFNGFRSFPGCGSVPGLRPGEVMEEPSGHNPFCGGLNINEIFVKLKLSEPFGEEDDLDGVQITVISDGSDDRNSGTTGQSTVTLKNGIDEYEVYYGFSDDTFYEADVVVPLSLKIPDGKALRLGMTATTEITILAHGAAENRPYAFFELESNSVNEGRTVRALISLDREIDLDNPPAGLTTRSVLYVLQESDSSDRGEISPDNSNYEESLPIELTVADLAGPAGTVHVVELTLKQDDLDTDDRTAHLRLDPRNGAISHGMSASGKGYRIAYTIVDNEAFAGFGPITRGREGGTVELTADFLQLPVEDLDGENAYARNQIVASYPGFGDVGNVTSINDQVGFFGFGSDLLYYGRDYYGAYVSQDGFLVLSRDTASDAATVNTITGLGDSNLSLDDARLADLPIVAPYWDNFQSDGATIRAGSVGTAGQSDYEIVVEWSNLKFADRTERVTFQVRINLLSGQIRYYYGDVSDGYGRGSTIGLGDGRGTPLTIVDEPGRSLSADARYVNDGTLIRLDPNYVYIVTERVGSEAGVDSREDILIGVPEILRAVDFRTTEAGVQWSKEFDVIDELDSVGQLPSPANPNFIWQTKLVLVSLNPNVNLGGGFFTETVNVRPENRLELEEYLIVDEEFEIKDLVVPITSVSEGQAFRATVDLSAGFPEIYRSGNSYARELNSGEPFNNIATTGTSLTGSGEVDFPFPFEFFGSYTRTVYVSNHGFLTLGSNAGDIEPGSINGGLGLIDANADLSKPVKGFLGIVPYGTKLSEGTRYYSVSGEFPNRRFTIQWNDYKIGTGTTLRPIGGTGERVTFQAVLHESTNRIEFKYDDLPVDPFLNGQIGITAPPGEVVCTVSCQRTVEDNLRRSFLVNGGSVIFTPGRDLLENSYDAVPTESEFEDISSYGTRLDVPEDGVVRERTVIEEGVAKEEPLSLPFQFAINNRLHTQLHIGENGFVILEQNVKLPNKGFDLTGAEYITNNDLSDGINGNVVIAPFWDDLIIEPDPDNPATANSGIYYAELGTGNDRRAIIQWEQVRSTSASDTPITFQVVLFRTGTDSIAGGFLNSSILLRYKDVTASVPAGGGGTASIGFFNGERDTVLIGFNEPVLNDGDAFAIVPPPALLELDLVDPEQRSDFDVTLQFPINLTSQLIDAVNSHNGEFPIRLTTANLQTSMDSEVEPNEEIKFVVRYTYDNLNLRSQKTAIVRVTDSGAEERTITSTIVLDAPDKDRAAGIVREGSSLHTLNVTLDAGALLGVDLSSLQRDFRSSGVLPLPSDQFEDISVANEAVKLAVSDEAGVVAKLGEFPPFQLFEHDINKALYVDSNGFLLPLLGDETEVDAFDSGANFGANSDLALQASAVPFVRTTHNSVGIIAPLWDDLVLGDGAVYAAHLGEPGSPDSRYIVQWDNVGFASGVGDPDNSITFQVVFYEGSSTRYEFRYKDVSVTNPANSNGNGATIGISEDAESGSHIEVGLNQPILTDNSRVFFSVPTLELRTDQPEQFGAPFRDAEDKVKAYYDLRPALLSSSTVTVQVEVYDDDLRERAMLLPFEVYAPTLEEDSRIKLTGTTRGEFLVIDNDLARATTLSVERVRLAEGTSTAIQFEVEGNVESSTIQFNNVGVAEITQFRPPRLPLMMLPNTVRPTIVTIGSALFRQAERQAEKLRM